jgi:hypothetical protein
MGRCAGKSFSNLIKAGRPCNMVKWRNTYICEWAPKTPTYGQSINLWSVAQPPITVKESPLTRGTSDNLLRGAP